MCCAANSCQVSHRQLLIAMVSASFLSRMKEQAWRRSGRRSWTRGAKVGAASEGLDDDNMHADGTLPLEPRQDELQDETVDEEQDERPGAQQDEQQDMRGEQQLAEPGSDELPHVDDGRAVEQQGEQ